MNDPAVIDEMLRTARTIAVVGMSDKTWRASRNIGQYLAAHGYRVVPVNPALNEVLGMQCYPDLDDAQAAAQEQTGAGIDLVDVFRSSKHVPTIVDDAIRLGIPYLWLQDEVTRKPWPAPVLPASNASKTTASTGTTRALTGKFEYPLRRQRHLRRLHVQVVVFCCNHSGAATLGQQVAA